MPKIHHAAVEAYYEALKEREEQHELDAAEAEQVLIDCEQSFACDEMRDSIDDDRYTLHVDELDAPDPYYNQYYIEITYLYDL